MIIIIIVLFSLASQPGAALEQTHIFCLAHVLRRPIIVYGIKYVKSWRGENLGYAKFEGVYLPLLWDPSFCYRYQVRTKSMPSLRGSTCHYSVIQASATGTKSELNK
jgi:hypothetical protein